VTHAAVWWLPSVLEPLQSQSMDRLFRLRAGFPSLRPAYDGRVFLVPIDDESAEMRESFYLGRPDYARLIDNLRRTGVVTQFLDVIFAAPEAEAADRVLEESLRDAGSAFVGMAAGATTRRVEGPIRAPSAEHQQILDAQRWYPEVVGGTGSMLTASRYFMTFPRLAGAAKGIGHMDLIPDRDGVIRRAPVLVRDGGGFLPSLFLLAICDYLGVEPDAVKLHAGKRLVLQGAQIPGEEQTRDISIPIDDRGNVTVNYVGAWGSIQTYPFSTIYAASDDRFELEDLAEELDGRLAVVSWFSTGRGDVGPIPTDPIYPRAGIWANAMNMILSGEFLYELSGWQTLLFVEVPLLSLLFVAGTRLSTIPYVLTALGMLVVYILIVVAAFLFANVMLNLPAPLFILAGAMPVVAAYQFHVEAQKRAQVKRELAVAREIQMGTLPSKMPQLDGYDLAGDSVPADETGGDSYDVIPLPEGRLMLLLGDATGHGIGPALSVTQVRSMLRVAMRLGATLDDAVTQINDQLADDLSANRFVTAFLGVLDGTTHQVAHHSAGQGPLLHYHAASGEFEWFASSRMALGMFGGLPGPDAKRLTMEPGDILALMTDGVFEQENAAGEQYGEQRVAALVEQHEGRPMQELLTAIYREVRAHRGQVAQSDDVTVLLVRRVE
jgi:serine phosphatase RsbU (regulator of sigma subunit)